MPEFTINPTHAITHLLLDDGVFPNNALLPLLVYKDALTLPEHDAAEAIVKVFSSNNWVNAWRNGIFPYHHYHSTAHEVLGISGGYATVQLGGPSGVIFDVDKGDVVVIPAGVAHKNIRCSHDFSCVGAYPRNGKQYDLNYGKPGERPATDQQIAQVLLPENDPLFAHEGGVEAFWIKNARHLTKKV